LTEWALIWVSLLQELLLKAPLIDRLNRN
jgi:hypothetical protein